jgi:hypothetical protein
MNIAESALFAADEGAEGAAREFFDESCVAVVFAHEDFFGEVAPDGGVVPVAGDGDLRLEGQHIGFAGREGVKGVADFAR